VNARFREPIRLGVQHWFQEPVYFGFEQIPELQKHFAEKTPFIFIDHAYFARGYERGNFRVIRNDIHQRTLKAVTKPKGKATCSARDWKKGIHILVFPPSYSISKTFDTKAWTAETLEELKKHTDRPIVVKKKDDGPLKKYLHECHAVVGYGTVASVEAAMMGYPVFSGPRCPATPIGLTDLSLIEKPLYPDRGAWFNTLTWSQFHLDEIKSGLVREVLNGIG
jgi:hypothetical protein